VTNAELRRAVELLQPSLHELQEQALNHVVSQFNVAKALLHPTKAHGKGASIRFPENPSTQHFVQDLPHVGTQYQEVHERAPRLAQASGNEIASQCTRALMPHLKARVLVTPREAAKRQAAKIAA